MADGADSFLYHPDSSFNFRYMFFSGCQVHSWTAWHGFDSLFEGGKLAVHRHSCNNKIPSSVDLVDGDESLEYRLGLSVGEVLHSCVINLPAVGEEKDYLIDKKYVSG